ncbi:MAG TPA: MBL fold metallo-hydrolase, partial [Acidimicrobiales bacterium]
MVNVTFWGVRGSTPCPSDDNRRYGGNTACVTIDALDHDPIVLDLGTGLRFFGESLPADGSFHGLALVTHLHWDHVQGLPFFVPINCPGATIDVHAPGQVGASVGELFDEFMRPPYFPVRASDLCGDIRFHDARSTDFRWGRAAVMVRDVPHVGETNGYRVEIDGVVIAYLSDHQEPVGSDAIAPSVLELCRDADLVIHDAQYDPAEFAQKSNWGHCTVDYAVKVAAASGAR